MFLSNSLISNVPKLIMFQQGKGHDLYVIFMDIFQDSLREIKDNLIVILLNLIYITHTSFMMCDILF